MTNQEYIDARDALIPLAERFANDRQGTSQAPGEPRMNWAARWGRTFLGRMDELVKKQGLVR